MVRQVKSKEMSVRSCVRYLCIPGCTDFDLLGCLSPRHEELISLVLPFACSSASALALIPQHGSNKTAVSGWLCVVCLLFACLCLSLCSSVSVFACVVCGGFCLLSFSLFICIFFCLRLVISLCLLHSLSLSSLTHINTHKHKHKRTLSPFGYSLILASMREMKTPYLVFPSHFSLFSRTLYKFSRLPFTLTFLPLSLHCQGRESSRSNSLSLSFDSPPIDKS